jgi:hypothetical protein
VAGGCCFCCGPAGLLLLLRLLLLLLLLRPTPFGGWRLPLLLRPAARSPLLLLIAPALHSRLLLLIRLLFLTLLLLTLLLLIAAYWSLTGRRFTSALTRGARRVLSKATPLTGGKRLRLRRAGRRADDVLGLPHSRLVAEIPAADVLGAYFHRSRDLCSSRQDTRAHFEGRYRTANRGCDYGGRNSRIDGEAPAIAEQKWRLIGPRCHKCPWSRDSRRSLRRRSQYSATGRARRTGSAPHRYYIRSRVTRLPPDRVHPRRLGGDGRES